MGTGPIYRNIYSPMHGNTHLHRGRYRTTCQYRKYNRQGTWEGHTDSWKGRAHTGGARLRRNTTMIQPCRQGSKGAQYLNGKVI